MQPCSASWALAPHVVSAALGHTIGDQLTAGYNKAAYSDAVRDAVGKLADRLDVLEMGGNIVTLPTPRMTAGKRPLASDAGPLRHTPRRHHLRQSHPAHSATKLIITDYVVDPTGSLAVAVAEKLGEATGKGRMRRRPPDVAFDESLLAELASRRIPFGVTKACIGVALEVATKHNKRLSPEGARTRVAELLRASRGRLRWRKK